MNEILGILTRVSSKPQEVDGTSLDVQRELGIKCGEKLGLEPMIFNEGSQSSYEVEINQRPVLVELLDKIQKKGGIRKVYVFNTDRLGRFSDSWFTILKVLFDYRVELYVGESLKPYDFSNPTDKLTINILSSVSIYDNELRRLRSVMGKRNSLKSGNTFIGGTIPFGYDVLNKKLIINLEESKIVKTIFEMYRDGKSTMDIKYYLDVQTDFNPKRSKSGWNIGTIQKMLGNSLYKGVQVWKWKEKIGDEVKVIETIEVKTPKIVSLKLWNDVQKVLDKNNFNKDNRKKNSTIFDGVLYCKSCKSKLSTVSNRDSKYRLYSCRSVEYKWKNPEKWEEKHQNCTLKKSVRVGSTDIVLINHLTSILKESKRVREKFKLKSLSSKFEDIENLKKKRTKKEKYLSEKIRYRGKLEDSIVDTELKIISSEITKSVGKKMKERVSSLIIQVNEQIQSIENELKVLNNSSEWIDWLNLMYLQIDSLENLPLKKQREFVSNYIKRIDVEYLPKIKSHRFHFKFIYPIVEDEIRIEGKDKSGRRMYEVLDGSTTSTFTHKHSSQRRRISDEVKDRLDRKISELRVEKSLSLSDICKELNVLGLKTPTNKKWDKPKLSSYIKYKKIDVGK